jgi:hypothetical protein
LNSELEFFVDPGLLALQPLHKLGWLVITQQLKPFFVVQLISNVLNGQHSCTTNFTHVVASHTTIGAQRIGSGQLVYIARFQLLAILEPSQRRCGKADYFALERNESFVGEDSLEALQKPWCSVVLWNLWGKKARLIGIRFKYLR